MNISTPFLIFSVYQASNSDLNNLKEHQNLVTELQDIGVKYLEVEGKYKGSTELAVLVATEHEPLVQSLTTQHNQECYLYVDTSRIASLHLPDGKVSDFLGEWKEVGSVAGIDSYSIIDGRYFRTVA